MWRAVEARLPAAVELRRELHAAPRLGGAEEPVAARLAELIGQPDAESVDGGRLLRIGDTAGPAIAVRAELDALPITEQTGVPWACTTGAMHACGHDVHLAALTAVAQAARDGDLPVPMLATLQPREETYPCGAVDVLASPAWAAHDVAAVVGVHLQPQLPAGQVSLVPGPVNAAADEFTVTVTGAGAHAAYPHLGRDPVVAMAAVVTALQHLVSRRTDPMDAAVLTIGRINGGQAANVIPSAVQIGGTLRSFDVEHRAAMVAAIESTAALVARAHDCVAVTEVSAGEPVLHNDPGLVEQIAPRLADAGFTHGRALRSCGADDFSYYCERHSAVMVFVGVGDAAADSPGLHHPSFLPPDGSVADVARAMVAGYLGACAASPTGEESAP
ncbi:MAG: amidohydrolase [Streptosporangiales bacterium]|nr:amidohydrolase [Streptosporangiales bacterium]